ncbi:MAG: 2-amino-4-hydroxy-6-hydroxymethyldihydropteridine pyrophosphokinase [Firmicutes bacterium ADurb.Bin506]|nr:MAG: 2-amino-4-hydroxy-6-hydroxymethyldihydropteridine pyrophosphokinase [Firmicutes bacterium ADurb.Bin506]
MRGVPSCESPCDVYFSLGSNLGDRADNLQRACGAMSESGILSHLRASPVYETDPWGPVPQGPFLNCVVSARTCSSPVEVLQMVRRIETELGRTRQVRWGPRTIDIDILLFGDETVDLAELQIPHPRMWERAFILIPLAELVPDMKVPGVGVTLREFAQGLADAASVRRLEYPDLRGVFAVPQNNVKDDGTRL